ncbi:phytanoyl-CoA dioxygenase family protein [Stutzerimonas azotifigens]|uniref:phytanoyl-CoA dioxygenase family protein n=1 Tax=Stutzerimonas azotifigens TaxID=291995 RepID=UPI000402438A|nr:phytanoyl-CoA dioxygenase family protein [Stutzerimonas azotifigens]
MANHLAPAQREHFQTHGYLYPLDALSRDEAAGCLRRLEDIEHELGEDPQKYLKIKAHLAAPWLVELAMHPAILDAVESLIGPDILLFGSSLFAKHAHDPRFVSWHQDSAYYGLDPHQEVTAWLAFTDATRENGCMRVLPGSHLGSDFEHEETYDPQNLLARGQTIHGLDESQAQFMELRAGQFSLHHEKMAHGSFGNSTANRRVGLAFFYMPAHTVSTLGRRSALLVRGEDRYGHWDSDPLPRRVLDPECMAHLREIWARYQDPAIPQAARARG